MQSSQQGVSKSILEVVKLDYLSVFELDLFVAWHLQIDWVHICSHTEPCVSWEAIYVIWAAHQKITDRWVVTDLLDMDGRAIRESGLVRLT